MDDDEKRESAARLLRDRGWDADEAIEAATKAVASGEPLLEFLCFQRLAEHSLAAIHSSAWVTFREEHRYTNGHEVIKRLVDLGASTDDLAVFARMMQREFLSNLASILDGAGICGTPKLPIEDFRVFSLDDSGNPQVGLGDLHQQLGWCDLETEMKLSQEVAASRDRTDSL